YTEGVPFWKWRTPSALRQVLFDRSFELLFYDYSTLLGGAQTDRYAAFAERYAGLYERDMERLRAMIDDNEDNALAEDLASGSSVILLSGTRRRRWTI
ncbi:MAG: hypothetical protein ACYTBS_10810, partial [Planctomycetota bacterium]